MLPHVPQVTIIMATYNRAHFIEETLGSILNQTFKDWECLIIDDGSTDNTQVILEPYLLADSRFKYHKRTQNHKKGLPGCRNQGLEIAKGYYVIFFDDDDIVHPDCLNVSVAEIEKENVDYCRFLRSVFYGNNIPRFELEQIYTVKILGKNIYEKMIMGIIPFNSCQVLWKKSCFNNELFNEKLMYAEEWELYSRILSHSMRGITINKVLYFGRKHSNSNTGEFYNNDRIRRISKKDAIVLIIQNLKEKQLLTNSLIRYFVQLSINFREFNLFNEVLNKLELSRFEMFEWRIFYFQLPMRLFFYRIYKKHF